MFESETAMYLGYLFGSWALGWILGFSFKAVRQFIEKST